MRAVTLTAAGAVVAAGVLAVAYLATTPGPAATDSDAAPTSDAADGAGPASANPSASTSPSSPTSPTSPSSPTGPSSPTEQAAAEVAPEGPPVLPTPVFDQPVVGAHVHALWDHYDQDTRAQVFDDLVAAGIRSVRVDVGWASLEEGCRACVSEWYVERLDRTVEQAHERGLDVLAVLWRTPTWAGDGAPEVPPHDAAEYGRVAGWLAERYAGRIDAWELWNEPNLPDYFHGGVEAYVELVRAAAPAIRASDPAATVVLAGPAHNDSAWLREALERDVGPLVDVIATHVYPTPADDPPSPEDPDGDIRRFGHLTSVVRVVAQLAPGTPVWVTEFGWSTHATQEGARAWERGVTQEQQAQYAVDSLALLRDRWPQVERAYWYRARDRATGRAHLDGFGLLDVDGASKPVLRELDRLLWEPVPGPGLSPAPGVSSWSAVRRAPA